MPYSYYDSSMEKSGPGGSRLVPKKSPFRHVKIAEDEFGTKKTEDLFYDIEAVDLYEKKDIDY